MILQQIFKQRMDEMTFPQDKEEAGEILEQFGYKLISDEDSIYGMVYHKAGEHNVLKLYDNKDYAFPLFVDFCRNNPNIHFPKFSRSIAIRGTNYSAVKTELLTKGNINILKVAENFADEIIQWNAPIEIDSPEMKQFSKDFPVKAREYLPWLHANKTLAEAFVLLRNHFLRNRKIVFDIHYDNMMMRGDTIVIIDPISPRII